MNKKLGLLMKIISSINIVFIVAGSLFSLLYLKNTTGFWFFYKVAMCAVFAILLYAEGDKTAKSDNYFFHGRDKVFFVILLISGIIMSIIQNIMFFYEINEYEKGFSCTLLAFGAFTLFDTIVKMNKKNYD